MRAETRRVGLLQPGTVLAAREEKEPAVLAVREGNGPAVLAAREGDGPCSMARVKGSSQPGRAMVLIQHEPPPRSTASSSMARSFGVGGALSTSVAWSQQQHAPHHAPPPSNPTSPLQHHPYPLQPHLPSPTPPHHSPPYHLPSPRATYPTTHPTMRLASLTPHPTTLYEAR